MPGEPPENAALKRVGRVVRGRQEKRGWCVLDSHRKVDPFSVVKRNKNFPE